MIWPPSLETAFFAEERAAIDCLLKARRGVGRESREIEVFAKAMKQKLLTQVRSMNADDYVSAKRFLTSLEYEMKSAPTGGTVAVR